MRPTRPHLLRWTLLCVTLLAVVCPADAQRQRQKNKKPSTILSVRDVANNYHVSPAYLSDTLPFLEKLDSMESATDNLTMAAFCNEISRRAQQMKHSLKNDYHNEGGYIWIDDRSAINDYAVYEVAIDRLIATATYRSQLYMSREQQRLLDIEIAQRREAEAEAARQAALRVSAVESTKRLIEQQHAAIFQTCDSRTIKDKSRTREYKSLYYSYLTVYNRYNLTVNDTSLSYRRGINELAQMQRHMLDSTLADNNYTSRIEHFPELLRDAAGTDYTDIVRAYNKYFVHTAVPITFTTVDEYYRYTRDLDDIGRVQRRYLEAVDLRKTITQNRRTINLNYEIRYRVVVGAYNDLEQSVSLVPHFNNQAEAESCIDNLQRFIAMQEVYLDAFKRFDQMNERGDSIYKNCRGALADIRSAYKKLTLPSTQAPRFRTLEEAHRYSQSLGDFEEVQRDYLRTVERRRTINDNDSRISHADNCEKVLANFYRTVAKQSNLTPAFSTAEGGDDFLQALDRYVAFQRACLNDIARLDSIARRDVEIRAYSKTHPNIYNVYRQVANTYKIDKIASAEDFARYERCLSSRRALQVIIIEILRSKDVDEINIRMHDLRDTQQMKKLLKVD